MLTQLFSTEELTNLEQCAYEKHVHFARKNWGKVFKPTTVLVQYHVEFCANILAQMMYKKCEPNLVFESVQTFFAQIFPKFYQGSLDVLTRLASATWNPSTLSCDYPEVYSYVIFFRHQKLTRYQRKRNYVPHARSINSSLILSKMFRDAYYRNDGSRMLMALQKMNHPDKALIEYAQELAYAPDSPAFLHAQSNFYQLAQS